MKITVSRSDLILGIIIIEILGCFSCQTTIKSNRPIESHYPILIERATDKHAMLDDLDTLYITKVNFDSASFKADVYEYLDNEGANFHEAFLNLYNKTDFNNRDLDLSLLNEKFLHVEEIMVERNRCNYPPFIYISPIGYNSEKDHAVNFINIYCVKACQSICRRQFLVYYELIGKEWTILRVDWTARFKSDTVQLPFISGPYGVVPCFE